MKNKKSGFSLLELIVVIGIIGVLAGVLMSTFGGATESAKAAQCMNNMRSLAIGAINAATANDDGVFPGATPWKFARTANGRITYHTHGGWISWIGGRGDNKNPGTLAQTGETSQDTLMYALTNGALWRAVGSTRDCYTCPVHKRAFEKRNKGRGPAWSYVMSEEFGRTSDERGSAKAYHAWNMSMSSKKVSKLQDKSKTWSPAADKILMFAEMQAIDIADKGYPSLKGDLSGTGDAGDPVLEWQKGETIGFNHMASGSKSQKYAGHVAFADGHVAKIYLPTQGSVQDLTKWLCCGGDVTYTGSRYELVNK